MTHQGDEKIHCSKLVQGSSLMTSICGISVYLGKVQG